MATAATAVGDWARIAFDSGKSGFCSANLIARLRVMSINLSPTGNLTILSNSTLVSCLIFSFVKVFKNSFLEANFSELVPSKASLANCSGGILIPPVVTPPVVLSPAVALAVAYLLASLAA